MRLFRVCCIAVSMALAGNASLAGEPLKKDPEETKAEPDRVRKPEEIVRETVDKVLQILGDPEYDSPGKTKAMREKVRRTILDVVDMDTVAVLTLANYRRKFSEEELKKFKDMFTRLLFSTYIEHLETYSNEKVAITGTKEVAKGRVQVKTKTITATKEIPVDYSFLLLKDRWKLFDVHVEGVSLVKNYRTQFREILLNQSPEQFLERLAKKVEENEKDL